MNGHVCLRRDAGALLTAYKRLFCLRYLHKQILVDGDRNVVLHMQHYHPIIKAIHRHFGWASSAKSVQLIRSFLLNSWVCCVCILYVCHYCLIGCSRTYDCFGYIFPLQTCLKVLISAPEVTRVNVARLSHSVCLCRGNVICCLSDLSLSWSTLCRHFDCLRHWPNTVI